MRRIAAALGVACALGGAADRAAAQFGSAMPGQVVGSSSGGLPGGSAAAPLVSQMGGTANGNTTTTGGGAGNIPPPRPYDPSRPLDVFRGTNLDPKSVVTPVPGYEGASSQPDFLDRLYTKLGLAIGFIRPAPPPPTTVTPGIFRRNRERAAERAAWRRD